MKAAGFSLGCITNKVARYTEPMLKSTGLAPYFDIVLSGDTLPEKKPHPLPLLHSAKFFGVPIEQLLLIGDSLSDAQAARAAGCPIFCVPYGYNHGEPVEGLNRGCRDPRPDRRIATYQTRLNMTHQDLLFEDDLSWRW